MVGLFGLGPMELLLILLLTAVLCVPAVAAVVIVIVLLARRQQSTDVHARGSPAQHFHPPRGHRADDSPES